MILVPPFVKLLSSDVVSSTVPKQLRLRTRMLPPNLEENMGLQGFGDSHQRYAYCSQWGQRLPLNQHLADFYICQKQSLLLYPVTELHLVKDFCYNNIFFFQLFNLSTQIWREELDKDRVGGLGKIHLEVDLLHLLLHVGERDYGEGQPIVHLHQVVMIWTVLGDWWTFHARPDLQHVFSSLVLNQLRSCRHLHPGQLLLQLQKESPLHCFSSRLITTQESFGLALPAQDPAVHHPLPILELPISSILAQGNISSCPSKSFPNSKALNMRFTGTLYVS